MELGAELYFIEHEKLPDEQKKLGYHLYNEDFIIQSDEGSKKKIYELTMSADAVLFGSKPQELFEECINKGKLTFNFSERLFKKGKIRAFLPNVYLKLRKKYLFNVPCAPYVLCASSYTASDYKLLGYPGDRFLKWGYFPKTSQCNYNEIENKKIPGTIVWVGRFIDWKHPEYVVLLASYLKKRNLDFHIKMIGRGELFDDISDMIQKLDVCDYIELVGALPPEDVLNEVEKSEIALVTSDRREGWGAVVNEAMGSACAVVANEQIGSVNYLIKNGFNGFTYSDGKTQEFFKHVETLLCDNQLRSRSSKQAYDTINNEWNYRIAAERLLNFIKERVVYAEGPISRG